MSESERGCGARLRRARLAAGLTEEDVAARLKMPVRVVRSLEADDWSRLGAPVFVRGQLRSYGRLVGLTTAPMLEASGVAPIEPPRLFSRSYTSQSQHLMEHAGRRLVYIVLTAAIVLPIWLNTRGTDDSTVIERTTPLDPPVGSGVSAPADADAALVRQPPVLASLAPLPARQRTAEALTLRFEADSWLQAVGPDGAMLEQAVIAAGETRSYAPGSVARIVLGNAGAVVVSRAGAAVDVNPYARANVARFTVSSDGSLAAVSD